MLYALFWVIPWRPNFICRHSQTLCLFHLHRHLWRWNRVFGNVLLLAWRYDSGRVLAFWTIPFHLRWSWTCSFHFMSVWKHWHIKFRRQGITQKKAYDSTWLTKSLTNTTLFFLSCHLNAFLLLNCSKICVHDILSAKTSEQGWEAHL